ncbi:hypothetical protein SERLADRAFT_468965 [Serpula lacrymans var. lacrymans S7.9]|uniref:Uncharacterized protein n=1 Tax=Serpula lacrymans var. lacrymans (strain S7.9) TaxID=578457 RepID=F8NW78_SERL9|nr:uncharacterized protein SERLADRAFT_468965 [Serpula lacrymans var. lacrymans S7.9]EGO24958.1 hypothetical protein SERLADRAFT_468965 [Serpula lacrymans var. lacrymans S7.9]
MSRDRWGVERPESKYLNHRIILEPLSDDLAKQPTPIESHLPACGDSMSGDGVRERSMLKTYLRNNAEPTYVHRNVNTFSNVSYTSIINTHFLAV